METINNIAGAASKAIWGEGEGEHKEPVSGETGNPKVGEPYDAGNLDSTSTAPAAGSTTATSNIGPIVDARDEGSKTVTNTSSGAGIGPVVDARGATSEVDTVPASELPSVASHTTKTESTAGGAVAGTVAGGAVAGVAAGATYLSYRPAEEKSSETTGATATTSTTTPADTAKLPQPSGGQSLTESHAVGGAAETAPAVQAVKDQAPLDGKNPETGKPFDGTRTGGKDDPTSSAGGKAGGAAEGQKAGKHSTSKFGALKDKIKAKLHKDKA